MEVEIMNDKNGDEAEQSGTTVCNNHPYSQTNNNQNPAGGGICGLCLQEKLGHLVSSSFPITTFPSSSFRSDLVSTSFNHHHHKNGDFSSSRAKIFPFLTMNQKKKKKLTSTMEDDMLCFSDPTKKFNLKRSKTSVVSRRNGFMGNEDFAPAKRGFWSFFYSTKSSIIVLSSETSPEKKQSCVRKVSRSRSVGCGSRSFPGDFFEIISTGLGDCTLRRVESQREAKTKPPISGVGTSESRVKCGGMFRGFSMTASPEEIRGGTPAVEHGMIPAQYSRNKKWGWVFASPIRAFSKNGAKSSKNTIVTKPDLNAMPSLLNVKT